jgi:hypothetical protein
MQYSCSITNLDPAACDMMLLFEHMGEASKSDVAYLVLTVLQYFPDCDTSILKDVIMSTITCSKLQLMRCICARF